MMPESIPIATAIAIPILRFPGVVALPGSNHWLLSTTHLKVLAKKTRIFQHHGITVGIGIGIAIAIENSA